MSGEKKGKGPSGDALEDPEVIHESDEEEQDLLDALMKKIESTGALEEEVESHFSDFSDRVDGVMDSIDRIEKIERSKMEKLLFHDDGEELDDAEREDGFDSLEDHIYLLTESPYEDVSEGGIHPDLKTDLMGHYAGEAENILLNLKKLIEIKLNKGEEEAAKDLFNMAMSMGTFSNPMKKEFALIMSKLGISAPIDKEMPDIPFEETETKVLDPDLAGGIDLLQKKAKNSLEKLNSLIDSSELSQEEFNGVKERYLEATELFREKRFHKAHQVALEGLKTIKVQAQDELENRIQNTLYKAKEMVEDLEKSDKIDTPSIIDDLKKDIDNAMKAFLTNEYEKANLLSKKVMNVIVDLTEPDSIIIKDRAKDIKHELERLREKNILQDDINELTSILESAEQLIKRRDNTSAGKVLEQITGSLDDVKRRVDSYSEAKEIEIRLSNRIKRLEGSEHDLTDAQKKLTFMKGYIKNGRFEDVLVIGEDLEKELSSLEHVKNEIEVKSLIEEIEGLMVHANELEDHEIFQSTFESIKKLMDQAIMKR